MNINKIMAVFLIICGSIAIVIGMFLGLDSLKPMNFNLAAGLVILIGTFLGLFGKQIQDKKSSEKSDRILQTG